MGEQTLVLSAAAGEKLGDDGAEVAVQHVRIALRLIRLLSAVCLPCVINLIETVTVKVSVGSAELGFVRVLRHLGILWGGQLVFADGFGLGCAQAVREIRLTAARRRAKIRFIRSTSI